MTVRRIWSRFATISVAFAILLSGAAAAAPAASGGNASNGLRVSPVRTDATINPGQSQAIPITVTNVTSVTANLQAVVNDFVASSDESGQPALLLNPNQFADSHSLKRYVEAIPAFSLQPGQQKTISINVVIPSNAAGGGYYGAVRFAPADSSDGKNQTVTLAGSVGTLILVKVPGDIKEQLNIASFDVRSGDQASTFFTKNTGITAVIRFQNGGNIQEAPFGKILLKNRSGKTLAEYEVNNTDPRGNVLPDSIRKFPVSINKIGSFGEYKLEGNFGYGSSGQLLSASTTFYVIPIAAIIIFIAVVIILAFMIFGFPRLLQAYNRRVITQASRSRRK